MPQWDVLDKQVRSIGAPACSLKDLLLTSWCQITQVTFRGLMESMPQWVGAILVAQGGPTQWAGGVNVMADCKSSDIKRFFSVAHVGRLSPKSSVLLLCDMQEKFRPTIFQFSNIVSNAARLLQACRILGIPPILTEQYPKGLGPTVSELSAEDLKPHAKTRFSMLTESVENELKSLGNPKQAILCGIEAQACIACTTYDLLDRGMEVHIVADAVSSRSQTDRLFALSRLKQSGAFLTTTEGVMLQIVQDAKHPNFKEIQRLLAHPSPDTGLINFFSSL